MQAAGRLLWLALGCGLVLGDDLARERVDLIELNHFYNDQAEHVFDQLIFLNWDEAAGRFQVRDWRMVKSPQMQPQRDWARGGWMVLWHDGPVLRLVHAAAFRETWTQYDPEVAARQYLPVEARNKLAQGWPKQPARR